MSIVRIMVTTLAVVVWTTAVAVTTSASDEVAIRPNIVLIIVDDMGLLPAWPRDWDVDFKLRAPRNTTVEGRFKDGALVGVTVTLDDRQKDMVVSMRPKQTPIEDQRN